MVQQAGCACCPPSYSMSYGRCAHMLLVCSAGWKLLWLQSCSMYDDRPSASLTQPATPGTYPSCTPTALPMIVCGASSACFYLASVVVCRPECGIGCARNAALTLISSMYLHTSVHICTHMLKSSCPMLPATPSMQRSALAG